MGCPMNALRDVPMGVFPMILQPTYLEQSLQLEL